MRVRLTPKLILLTLLASGWLLTPSSSRGQVNVGGRNEVFAGSDLESYLRYLQILGKSNAYPWSMRAFSPWEIDQLAPTDANHPWAARYDLQYTSSYAGLYAYVPPPSPFSPVQFSATSRPSDTTNAQFRLE